MNGIHNGIQAGHAACRLVKRAYEEPKVGQDQLSSLSHTIRDLTVDQKEMVKEWAQNHETFVILNGGDSEMMKEHINFIINANLPFELFFEPGIDNALTSICIIVPPRLYEVENWRNLSTREEIKNSIPKMNFFDKLMFKPIFEPPRASDLTDDEILFIRRLKACPLAK